MSEPVSGDKTEIIGRYALHGRIAAGGMAAVYFGRLLGPVGFSRPVAVKRLHPQLAREENVRRMFIDEARLASRIAHPNVVPTLDVVEAGEELLLVLEYVHGESLQQLMRAARSRGELVPLPIALAVIVAVLHGLHAAHEATGEDGAPLCIVHRDVSPQNVMVGVDGVARVLDFGIARAAVRLASTHKGIVKGKLAYMAPEQRGGAPVDRRADIYATAVMLWELLASRRLFARDDGANLETDKLLQGTIEPPSHHRPGVPKLLDAITLHGLARAPERRFETAREMALALEKIGEIARPSEIGEWVEQVASEKLAERRARLKQLEATSSTFAVHRLPGAAPAPAEGDDDEPVLEVVEHDVMTPSGSGDMGTLQSAVAPSLSPPQALALSVSMRRASGTRMPLVAAAYALLGGAVTFAVMSAALGRFGGGASGSAPAAVASQAPVAAAMVPPPSCPEGMATIPGGRFLMGSDDGMPMERPSHNVTLPPYCMDLTEATTEDYKACSDDGACRRAGTTNDWDAITDADRRVFDPLCNVRDPQGRAKHPINCVDWEMASIFCKAHGKRLPTEAEWELAARGTDGRKYPWGDEEPGPTLLNACGKECVEWSRRNHVDARTMFDANDGWANTSPVGSFPRGASRYGLHDVVGNVGEWVSDWYAEYDKADAVSPGGPTEGRERVIRGGAWNGSYPAWVRPTFRYKDVPTKRSYGIGFRCAASL
jgi:serine/threonine-protein kinase